MKGFSGIKDIDMKILMELGDEDLYDVCQTDKRIRDICNDDIFWMRRTMLKKENIAKPENMSWRQYYESLIDEPYLSHQLFYIKENAQQFFKEANLGLYNGIPLNDNLTETVGISSYKNITPLFNIYFRTNNVSRPFKATELMNKYFNEELNELEAEGKFDRNNFPFNRVSNIFSKLILKPMNTKTIRYAKMSKLVEKETDILSKLANPEAYYEHQRMRKLEEENKRVEKERKSMEEERKRVEEERILEKERMLRSGYEKEKNIYELKRKKDASLYYIPFMSFEYFNYLKDPNSKESLEMKHEYEDRKESYIQSFYQIYPNSPQDPQYESFKYFNYDETRFPREFKIP